jgi:predicted transcriptional regulator
MVYTTFHEDSIPSDGHDGSTPWNLIALKGIFIFSASPSSEKQVEGCSLERRARFEVMAEILSSCRRPRGKTKIMHRTNMSWKTVGKYLAELQLAGLLEIHNSPIKYSVTAKGLTFLDKWVSLRGFLQTDHRIFQT